jgi:hypothetical protein
MSPEVMRLAEPRFLGPARKRDFRFFLETQCRDLATLEDVTRMVELCFSRKNLPGLESAFWRFEAIEVADSQALRVEIARRVWESNRGIGSIARIIIEEVARFSGHGRALVKFPVEVVHIPKLIEWFPDCRVIHITRDPRALAMSKGNDPSGTASRVAERPYLSWLIRKGTLVNVIREYRRNARTHSELDGLPNYRLYRYEDLLVDPEGTVRDVCRFIDVEFVPEMLTPEKGRHKHQPSSLTGKRQDAFDPSAAVRWRSVMSRLDRWLVTALTRVSMRRMGYDAKKHRGFV